MHPGSDTRVGGWNSLRSLVITQNPFYLISVAFVFHGSSRWFQASPNHDPWMLMGLVSGFILLMAGTAFAIVRWGNVWDDARSIFILVLVLFVELAMVFDDSLVRAPEVGVPLALCGYAFCVAVFEGLLFGLRTRLGPAFRVPVHVMLALMFLYPLTVLPASGARPGAALQWQLFAFSVLVAGAVLMLVPAVRRGREYVANNGTPWAWPVFPWVPVAVIVTGLCLRAYAACASFDPSLNQSLADAMKLQSVFAGYFAVPLVLAIGVLLMEAVGSRQRLANIGLMMPVLAVWLSVPPEYPTTPQADFLSTFSATCGSPLFVTTILVCAFYGYALLRRVPNVGFGLAVAGLLAAVVHPETFGIATLGTPRVEFVRLLALAVGVVAWRKQSLGLAWFGLTVSIVALHIGLADFGSLRLGIDANFLMFALVGSSVFTRSRTTQLVVSVLATTMCVATLVPLRVVETVPIEMRLTYVVLVGGLLLAVAVRWKLKPYMIAASACFAGIFALLSYEAWLRLQNVRGVRGLVFYVAGVVWFLVAVGISVLKAQRARVGGDGDAALGGG